MKEQIIYGMFVLAAASIVVATLLLVSIIVITLIEALS